METEIVTLIADLQDFRYRLDTTGGLVRFSEIVTQKDIDALTRAISYLGTKGLYAAKGNKTGCPGDGVQGDD